MELLRFGIVCVSICLCMFVRPSAGNAWLMDPPSRSAAWNYGIKAPINYDFRTLNCGDQKVEIQADGTRNCGLCGDPVTDPVPRPNENGGIYAPTTILTRFFEAGQTVEISIHNNYPDQLGFYEFRLCENGDNPTQACLDNNLLFINDSNDYRMPVPGQGFNIIHVRLPQGLTCSHCLLQWRYKKDNSAWGCDSATGWCGLGYGAQKEYYNCADVMIGAVGTPKPSIIQDPTYTSVDYGSAYDTATQDPGPSTTGSNPTTTDRVVGTTTTAGGRIVTVPPVTTPNPTGTTPATTPAQDDRLVIIDTGNSANPLILINDEANNNNINNNAGLLLLLGLLPLLGALGQTAGVASAGGAVPLTGPVAPIGGAVAPVAAPLSPSAFWNSGGFGTPGPFSSGFTSGNSFGYGSFGSSYGNNYGNKGGYYGNKNSYYGNQGNTWGSNVVSTAGHYPLASGVGNFQYAQTSGNGQFAPSSFSTVNSLNTIGSNNFVVKSETFVKNGISRQPLNPAFAGSNGIQWQQNQYQSGQQHDYNSGWQNQQNEYSNDHVNNYNQAPATNNRVITNTGNAISSWQNNGWNSIGNNGWDTGNQNGFNNVRNHGLGNENFNGFGHVNTNNFGTNGLNNNGNWNNVGSNVVGSTWTGTRHKTGFTHVSHPVTSQGTSYPWQRGTVQPSSTVPRTSSTVPSTQPPINNLYPQLFGGFSNQQSLRQGVGNLGSTGFQQTLPVRSL